MDVAEGLGRVDQVKLVTMAAAIAEGLGRVDQRWAVAGGPRGHGRGDRRGPRPEGLQKMIV